MLGKRYIAVLLCSPDLKHDPVEGYNDGKLSQSFAVFMFRQGGPSFDMYKAILGKIIVRTEANTRRHATLATETSKLLQNSKLDGY